MNEPGSKPLNLSRAYMGLQSEQRSAERRRRLVDAGIRIIGARGCTQLGVRNVCAEADLSHRYFYESFKCKEELLLAAYEKIQQCLISDVIGAMGHLSDHCSARLGHSVEAFLQFFLRNEHARWILFESNVPRTSRDAERWALLSDYEAMLVDELLLLPMDVASSKQAARVMACGLVGATIQLTVRWLFYESDEPINVTLSTLRFIYEGAIRSLSESPRPA